MFDPYNLFGGFVSALVGMSHLDNGKKRERLAMIIGGLLMVYPYSRPNAVLTGTSARPDRRAVPV